MQWKSADGMPRYRRVSMLSWYYELSTDGFGRTVGAVDIAREMPGFGVQEGA